MLRFLTFYLCVICRGMELLQEIQTSSTRKSPFAEAALQKLLDNNLSAKYALTGCLSKSLSSLMREDLSSRVRIGLKYTVYSRYVEFQGTGQNMSSYQ